MINRKDKKMSEQKGDSERILVEIEKDLDSVITPKNLAKAGKLHRELSVLSTDDLLSPFTI